MTDDARMRARLPLLVLSLLLVPTAAAAQRTSYQSVLIGEHATGMGGAFVALSDDSSAVVHNPAGLGDIRTRGLSLSANTYSYQREIIHDVLSGHGESASMDASAVMAFPNQTAYVLPLGGGDDWSHTAAVSLNVPYGLDFTGHEKLGFRTIYFDIDFFRSIDERVYLVGPSYGLRVGRISIGASLFVQYVSMSVEDQLVLTVAGTDPMTGESATYRQESFQYTTTDYYGLTGVLGVLLRPHDRWSIGARVRLPNLRIAGSATTYRSVTSSAVVTDAMGVTTTSLYQDAYREVESDTDYRYPVSFALGAAYRNERRLRIALEVSLHLPLDPYATLEGELQPPPAGQPGELPGLEGERGFDPTVVDPGRRLVVNLALGTQIHLAGDFSMLAGIFTDHSAVPDDGIDEQEQIDSFGLSLALSRLHAGTSLTVGATTRLGQGRATGLRVDDAGQLVGNEVDVTFWSVTLFVAGSSTLGADDPEAAESQQTPR